MAVERNVKSAVSSGVRLATLLAAAAIPVAAFAQTNFVERIEFTCGGAETTIEVIRRDSLQRELRVESVITVARDGVSTILRYWGAVDYVGGVCFRDSEDRPRIVYAARCGGSGCDTESNWGIVDPSNLRVLLVPADGNVEVAQGILGDELPAIDPVISVAREDQRLYPDQQ